MPSANFWPTSRFGGNNEQDRQTHAGRGLDCPAPARQIAGQGSARSAALPSRPMVGPGMVQVPTVLSCRIARRAHMTTADHLPFVEAELNYLGPTAERPRSYASDRAGTAPHRGLPIEP